MDSGSEACRRRPSEEPEGPAYPSGCRCGSGSDPTSCWNTNSSDQRRSRARRPYGRKREFQAYGKPLLCLGLPGGIWGNRHYSSTAGKLADVPDGRPRTGYLVLLVSFEPVENLRGRRGLAEARKDPFDAIAVRVRSGASPCDRESSASSRTSSTSPARYRAVRPTAARGLEDSTPEMNTTPGRR